MRGLVFLLSFTLATHPVFAADKTSDGLSAIDCRVLLGDEALSDADPAMVRRLVDQPSIAEQIVTSKASTQIRALLAKADSGAAERVRMVHGRAVQTSVGGFANAAMDLARIAQDENESRKRQAGPAVLVFNLVYMAGVWSWYHFGREIPAWQALVTTLQTSGLIAVISTLAAFAMDAPSEEEEAEAKKKKLQRKPPPQSVLKSLQLDLQSGTVPTFVGYWSGTPTKGIPQSEVLVVLGTDSEGQPALLVVNN